MKKPALLLCVFLALQVLPAQAAMIVNDHFDDSVLDPAWNVNPRRNAKGWTYQESGTHLTVTGIDPIASPVPSGVVANWAVIELNRNVGPILNFNLDFDMSWNEGAGGIWSIQMLDVQLIDGQGDRVAWAGYYNNWYGGHGSRAAGGNLSGPYVQDWAIPANGSANIDILKNNGEISILWNDALFWSGFSDSLVQEVLINFGYYPLAGATFGSLSVDQVKLESSDLSATPEPGTLALLGSALALGAWFLRRKHHRRA